MDDQEMVLTEKEQTFLQETVIALLKGARIGSDHYTVTIDRVELENLAYKIVRLD